MTRDKSFIMIVILLVIVAGLSMMLYLRKPVEATRIQVSDLPMQIAEWKGEDILLEDRTYAILETKNVVMRKYENPKDESVYLYTVVSEVNRKVAHPPEVCYTGGGIEILEKDKIQFSVPDMKKQLAVNSFVSRKNGSESLVFYWYKSGDKFTTHYLVQQANMVMNQIMGKISPVALIRVSTSINNGNREKASQTLQEFSRKVVPLILEYTP